MRWVRRHPIVLFVTVTYAVTWTSWLSIAAMGRTVGTHFEPLYLLGLVGPLIGGLVTTAVVAGKPGLRDWLARFVRARVPLRWWTLALGLPLLVAAVTALGAALIATFGMGFETSRNFGAFSGFPALPPIVMWLALIAVNGFGEEAGWRGTLLPALREKHSPLVASLLVAVPWIVWHAPAFLITETYRQMPVAMIPMFAIGIACGAVFLGWLYLRGGNSILLVAVWHGTFNLLTGSPGARGALSAIETLAVMIAAVILISRRSAPWQPRNPTHGSRRTSSTSSSGIAASTPTMSA